MKLITIILVSLVISINAFSQKLVRTYYDYRKTKIQAEYYTNAYGVKNGIFKGYSEYGGILLQGALKDGAAIGKWIENYEDGKLQCVKIYNSPGLGLGFGMNDGQVIEYYEDGKTIKSEKNYKNQEYDGDYKIYDENGTLTLEGKYVNGVLKLSEVFQRIYDEKQEKQKQLKREEEAATLKKKTEEYEKNILIADKALASKDYKEALKFYNSASNMLEKEKYPKDRISEMKETLLANSKFFDEYFKNDSLFNDFNVLKADFKIKIVKEYNKTTYVYDVKSPQVVNYRTCLEPWNEPNTEIAFGCFKLNKEFYEPYQIAITEAYFKYIKVLSQEKRNYDYSDVSYEFTGGFDKEYGWDYKKANLHTYDKTTFLNNLKETKENFEHSKSLKTNYLKALENKVNITNLNEQNKKKTLLKKYLIVYEDLISKINAYSGLSETISLLKSLNSVSDKVVGLYSQETKDLEKKLKDAETSEQIQAVLLGQ
jgi:antitoxin component YwqK of YwqJK toxin-antitoxin module